MMDRHFINSVGQIFNLWITLIYETLTWLYGDIEKQAK